MRFISAKLFTSENNRKRFVEALLHNILTKIKKEHSLKEICNNLSNLLKSHSDIISKTVSIKFILSCLVQNAAPSIRYELCH